MPGVPFILKLIPRLPSIFKGTFPRVFGISVSFQPAATCLRVDARWVYTLTGNPCPPLRRRRIYFAACQPWTVPLVASNVRETRTEINPVVCCASNASPKILWYAADILLRLARFRGSLKTILMQNVSGVRRIILALSFLWCLLQKYCCVYRDCIVYRACHISVELIKLFLY